MDSVYK